MSKPKTSIIWKPTKEEFQKIVNSCFTLASILRVFNLHVGAGNYKTLKKRIKEENINIEHIQLGISSNKGRSPIGAMLKNTIPLEEILVEKSTYNHGKNIKRRLFAVGLLENKCYECGQLPIWNHKPLVLQLDHINGIHDDNRLENLRILCPHCHSQTETFNGRNNKTKYRCVDCDAKTSKNCVRCQNCENKNKLNKGMKIKWPTNDELLLMLRSSNFAQIAKKLGVSDNSIRRRLERRGLNIK